MAEQLPTTSSKLHDVVRTIADDEHVDYVETHSRFNLGGNGGLDVVFNPERPDRDRVLVAAETTRERDFYDQLDAAGVPQLSRTEAVKGIAMYRLPFQAKPLSRERLFVGHQSTSTYVSDEELFGHVGNLWRSVYESTGHLPQDGILASTVLLDFKDVQEALVPLPPYSSWQHQNDGHEAKVHLESLVAFELQAMNPHISHGLLLGAVTKGWRHDGAE